jgi:hypothetical protein
MTHNKETEPKLLITIAAWLAMFLGALLTMGVHP